MSGVSEAAPFRPDAGRTVLAAIRLLFAVSCAVALVFRFVWGLGSATFSPENFFGYLTVQSALAFIATSLVAGVTALRGRNESPLLTSIRAAVLTCTVTAGIVFALIVQQAGVQGVRVDLPWSDVVLHFVLPPVAVAEWALAPGRGRARWGVIVFALGYAATYGGITVARGAIVGWYPYYFLDPGQLGSPGEFITLSALSLTVFLAVGLLIVGLTRVRWIPTAELRA